MKEKRVTDMSAKILIVDDNPSMREAIGILLAAAGDLTVCGEAGDIAEALARCRECEPDLALIDLSLKGEDGLDLVRCLRETAPHVRTVVLSLHDEPLYINGARAAGASGYVVKSEEPDEMLACIRNVLNGRTRFPPPCIP